MASPAWLILYKTTFFQLIHPQLTSPMLSSSYRYRVQLKSQVKPDSKEKHNASQVVSTERERELIA